MKITNLLLSCFLIQNVICPLSLPYNVTVTLLYVIRNHFMSSWICLLYSDPKDIGQLALLQKRLFKLFPVQSAALTLEHYMIAVKSYGIENSRPLHAFLSLDFATKPIMSELLSNKELIDPLWVLLAPKDIHYRNFFSGINIPFNSVFLVITESSERSGMYTINEVYRVAMYTELQIDHFGSWSMEDGLKAPTQQLYRRRRNLQGIVMNVSYLQNEPGPGGKPVVPKGGLFGITWQHLENNLNFTSRYIPSTDGVLGSLGTDGTFNNGLVGMLIRGEADVALAMMAISPTRAEVVDFPVPAFTSEYIVYILRPHDLTTSWKAYALAFNSDIWTCTLLFLLIVPAAGLLCYWLSPPPKPEESFLAMFFVYASLCQQGSEIPRKPWALRCLILCSYLAGLILYTAYCSSLISTLAVNETPLPFHNFDEFVEDDSYSCAVVKNSAEQDLFYHKKNSNSIFIEKLTNKMVPVQELPTNAWKGLLEVCSKDIHALIVPQLRAEPMIPTLPCKIASIPTGVSVAMSMAFAKRSAYLDLINSEILRGLEMGWIHRSEDESKPLEAIANQPAIFHDVELSEVVPFFVALIIGAILSLLFLFCELNHRKRNKNLSRFSKNIPTRISMRRKPIGIDPNEYRRISNKNYGNFIK